jgi:competence protein ComGC
MILKNAIPEIQAFRNSNNEYAILNNQRQIASAADLYFLEKNAHSVSLVQLEHAGYLKFENVEGEIYPQIIRDDDPYIKVIRSNGKIMKYNYNGGY